MTRVVWLALALSVASTLTEGRALAAGEWWVSLEYLTPPEAVGCPSAAEFRNEVARQLGRDPFRPGAARRLTVRLYSTREGTGGRIDWRDAQGEWEGERTFSSRNETCAAMARSIELATAIQIDLLSTLNAVSASEQESPDLEEEQPPPVPLSTVIQRALPEATKLVRPPRFSVALGAGVVHDFGSGPNFAMPRLAVSVGRPQLIAVRLSASGFGPGTEVTGLQGTAVLDLFLTTVDVVRSFRADQRIRPFVTAGAGLQDVRVRGTSAMPSLAAAHDGHGLSALMTVGGGLNYAFARRLSLVVEGDALFFRPSVAVKVGPAVAADLDGAALFFHGGLFAEF